MKEVTWREYKCRHGQGPACCIHLVINDKEVFRCDKIVPAPEGFHPIPEAQAIITDCEGVKDLPAMESAIQTAYTTARTLKVKWRWKWFFRSIRRALFAQAEKIAIVNKTVNHGRRKRIFLGRKKPRGNRV